MKAVEVGNRVRITSLGATGTVETIDADGYCWLTVDRFPGRMGLRASELRAVTLDEDRHRARPRRSSLTGAV